MTKPIKNYFDAIIIGSGPAGVSAAFPLVMAGMKVLMVDGGRTSSLNPPDSDYLDARKFDRNQWRWMIGEGYHALNQMNATSPKLRAPINAEIFSGFKKENSIIDNNYMTVGSLASGGLSNAWGCGVAFMDDRDLSYFPFGFSDLKESYAAIVNRIGVSGGACDDLSSFYGMDEMTQPPIPLDELQKSILHRYYKIRKKVNKSGFNLGQGRVAVLTKSVHDRLPCNLSGNCLWGCSRRSIYTSGSDLEKLRQYTNFYYEPGTLVKKIIKSLEGSYSIEDKLSGSRGHLSAEYIVLAAGTLATTRLALEVIEHRKSIEMESSPSAAFMLWMPQYLGRGHSRSFGLGQLSYTLESPAGDKGFGSLFNTTGIPLTEFARHLPFGTSSSMKIMSQMASSCIVGNLFLPGKYSDVNLTLDENNNLKINGGHHPDAEKLMMEMLGKLKLIFWKLRAPILPGSFRIGLPGTDIHYSGSLPMTLNPVRGQTSKYGELENASRVFIVDGASLSSLPSKPHTLTIMANADRIAKYIAQQFQVRGGIK